MRLSTSTCQLPSSCRWEKYKIPEPNSRVGHGPTGCGFCAPCMPGPDTSATGSRRPKATGEYVKKATWGMGPRSPLPRDLKAGPHRRSLSGRLPASSIRSGLPCRHACTSISLRTERAGSVCLAHTSVAWPCSQQCMQEHKQITTPVHNGVYHWYHLNRLTRP